MPSGDSIQLVLETTVVCAQLDELVTLLKQIPESVFRDFFGDVERLLLQLSACEFTSAACADERRVVFELRFSRFDELLATARRASFVIARDVARNECGVPIGDSPHA